MSAPGRHAGISGWRYGLLGLPLAFVSLPVFVLLPDHYATRYGTALPALGAVLLSVRGIDAIADPLIGRWVDRLFGAGATTPIAIGAGAGLVLTAGFGALWAPPGEAGFAQLAWLAAALVTTQLSFSVITVIHQAWGARRGGSEQERARVFAWREGIALVGVTVAGAIAAWAGFSAMTVALAVTLAIGLAALAASGDGREIAPGHGRAIDPVRCGASPWADPAFRALMAIFTLNGVAGALPATLASFFVRDVLQAPSAFPVFLGAYFLAAAIAMPAWVRGVRAIGLARTWLLAMALAVAAFCTAPLLGAGDLAAFAAICIGSGAALGADLALAQALLAGVVRAAGGGGSEEGRYFGWWAFFSKLNLALAAGLALPLLSWLGYRSGARSPEALGALVFAYAGLPCLFKLAAATLLWRAQRFHAAFGDRR